MNSFKDSWPKRGREMGMQKERKGQGGGEERRGLLVAGAGGECAHRGEPAERGLSPAPGILQVLLEPSRLCKGTSLQMS